LSLETFIPDASLVSYRSYLKFVDRNFEFHGWELCWCLHHLL
jgi:hypothetical protein